MGCSHIPRDPSGGLARDGLDAVMATRGAHGESSHEKMKCKVP